MAEQATGGEIDGTQVYGLGEGPINTVTVYEVPVLTDGVVLDNPVLEATAEPVPAVEEPAVTDEPAATEEPAVTDEPADPATTDPI